MLPRRLHSAWPTPHAAGPLTIASLHPRLRCRSTPLQCIGLGPYSNGDIISHGIQITLPKYMTKWELLIRDICNATGQFITTIYTAQGKKLSRIEQIEHGYIYVAAG